MSLFAFGLLILAVISWPLLTIILIETLDYMTDLLRRIESKKQ